jgi:hypothetical protein
MSVNNFRLLCTALGFTAVIVKNNIPEENRAARAIAIARMIEEFCRVAHPDLFKDEAEEAELDQIIEDLKDEELHIAQLADLTGNKNLLHRVYDRLLQHHREYATDAMIVGEIEHFLGEEIHHKTEDKDDDCERSRR